MSRLSRNAAGLSRLTWAAAIVVGASLPHWTRLPIWMPALLVLCVTWRFGARLLRWPLPGRKLMWLITIAAFGAVLLQFRTINGLLPGTALLVVMLSLKFLEAKNQRDHMLLTVMAYFLVFASLLFGGGLVTGLYLLAFVWLTTIGLLQVGRQGRLLAGLPTARQSGRLLLQSAPLMVVLFLLFPRLSGPLWALPGDTSSGATGLSGSMSPGDITDLGLSDEIAFRADFDGQAPPASDLYWRGPVLSNFDGRTWVQSDGMRGDVYDTIEFLGDATEYRVMLEPNSRGWAFALEMPQVWNSEDRRQRIRMLSDYRLGVWPSGQSTGRLAYWVTSYSDFRATEPLGPRQIEVLTRLPAGFNPRTRALVDSWLEDSPSAQTIINRGLDVFRQDGFFYTLTPPALGEHTADEFIFDTKEGFCEHYASAFAIMMRMAGLPTRVVTGYQGGELNAIGEYYIVRQTEAHAWTEVWTERDGWIRVDPISAVAPERIAAGSTRTFQGPATIGGRIGNLQWLRQAALAWDAVSTFWNNSVLGYGPRLQRMLLEWLGFERPRSREMVMVAVLTITLLLAGMATSLHLQHRRTRARDPAARSFATFVRRLRQLSVGPLLPGETPTAFAARATRLLPQHAETIDAVTTAYLCARYERDDSGRSLARLKSLVRSFRPGYARA